MHSIQINRYIRFFQILENQYKAFGIICEIWNSIRIKIYFKKTIIHVN